MRLTQKISHRISGRLSAGRRSRLAAPLVLLLGLLVTGGHVRRPLPRHRPDPDAPTRTWWPRARRCSSWAAPPATARTPRASAPPRAASTAPPSSASAPRRSTSRSAPAGCRWPSPAPRPCASPRSTTRRRSRRSRRTSPPSAPGPPSPTEAEYDASDVDNEDVVRGGEFFRTNCTACHNFAGAGGALPRGRFAPSLDGVSREAHVRGDAHRAPADAGLLRRGAQPRGQAPDHRLPEEDRGDARRTAASRSARSGPVSEGLFAWLIGIGALVGAAVWIGANSTRSREEGAAMSEKRELSTLETEPIADPGPPRARAPPDRRRRHRGEARRAPGRHPVRALDRLHAAVLRLLLRASRSATSPTCSWVWAPPTSPWASASAWPCCASASARSSGRAS